jgi:3-methylfumaryl-CoA hydratase
MYRDEVPGTDGLDLLLMAGGQEVRWLGKARPGDDIRMDRRVRSVERKRGPSAGFLVLTVDKSYRATGRGDLVRVTERFIVASWGGAPGAGGDQSASSVPGNHAAAQSGPDPGAGAGAVRPPAACLVPDPTRLLRFGAATRNAHRIHYDPEFARTQGLSRPVVMAQLHGCLLFRAAAAWAGDPCAVRALGWRNRTPAYPGDRLAVSGIAGTPTSADGTIRLELAERRDDGTVCCAGYAVVVPDAAGLSR